MRRQSTHQKRTERAFRAYSDLLDAGEQLKPPLRWALGLTGLTLEGFRLLELLHREGALPVADISRGRGRRRESMLEVIGWLEKRGWAGTAIVRLPPVSFKRAHLPKSKRDVPREGQKIAVVGLTASGKKFIGEVLTNYSKVFDILMGGIDGREQESLSRICRKLRKGDAAKFIREIRMMDEAEEAEELVEKVKREMERARWARMRRRLRIR